MRSPAWYGPFARPVLSFNHAATVGIIKSAVLSSTDKARLNIKVTLSSEFLS
ncbi:hypothetical protein ACRALDRAFT_2019057 [Sodiomyces alcalophilus JCM 7366]|uniref:uncharacterized protein n=1 Tax=Sodiomyces alcalophilus JCM 7366 TaxID=591952 RepID=UPI0039B4F07B